MPIEQRGVDTAPEARGHLPARTKLRAWGSTSGPRDLVSILLGSNLCLAVIIFGRLPVSFGLGWWAPVSAVVAGTVVGTLLTAPLTLVSLRTATNLSTSSGAQFGVRGRLVGSVVSLLLSLGYTALTVWIGGDAMTGVLHRLFGLPTGGLSYGIVYALLAAATVIGAVYGYRVLLRLSRIPAVVMTALLILGIAAYAPHFTTAALPGAGGYLLGSFWPTRLFAMVAAGHALQVFNRRSRGGVYWYRAGWNLRAAASWGLGAGVGLLAVSLPNHQGPLLSWTGGVDCSFLLSGVVGGLAYLALTARPGQPKGPPRTWSPRRPRWRTRRS
ncbi:cytosine permease [Streptomyces sp. NPDC059928]|uniref:cytosine permease n=1 Tax=unclassified Streptomyces TaxID=2593676 RepID=UPI00365C4201